MHPHRNFKVTYPIIRSPDGKGWIAHQARLTGAGFDSLGTGYRKENNGR